MRLSAFFVNKPIVDSLRRDCTLFLTIGTRACMRVGWIERLTALYGRELRPITPDSSTSYFVPLQATGGMTQGKKGKI